MWLDEKIYQGRLSFPKSLPTSRKAPDFWASGSSQVVGDGEVLSNKIGFGLWVSEILP